MKLIPKAKPVRIRILSGGEEHSSLDSLRNNFVWKDIEALLDGRLLKWLRRIDKNEEADLLSLEINSDLFSSEKTPQKIIIIYNIIFRKDNQFNDIKDIFLEAQHDESLIPVIKELAKYLTWQELQTYSYQYGHLAEIFTKQICHMSRNFINQLSGQDLYNIGKDLYEKPDYKEEGIRCIQEAIIKGSSDAQEFKNKNLISSNSRTTSLDLESLLKSEDVQKKMDESWKHVNYIPLFPNMKSEEQNLYRFSNACLNIYLRSGSGTSTTTLWKIAEEEFIPLSKNDILYQEKAFVLALLAETLSSAKHFLSMIPDYAPARNIRNNRFVFNSSHSLYACGGFISAQQLKFFVNNLLKFRNYGKSN